MGRDTSDDLPNTPDWDEHQRLAAEKEVLGFFISGHPLEKYASKLEDFRAMDTSKIAELTQGSMKDEITTGGIITGLKVMKSKKGDLYANAALEDMTGKVDLIIFPEAYKRLSEHLKMEVPVLVRGNVRAEEGASNKLAVTQILSLEDAKPKLPRNLRIRIPLDKAEEGTIDALHSLCRERKGEATVLFDLERPGEFLVVMEAESYN